MGASAGLLGYTWFTRDTVDEWQECPDCDHVSDVRYTVDRAPGKYGLFSMQTSVDIEFHQAFTGHVRVETLDEDGKVLEGKTVAVENQTSLEVSILGEAADDVIVKVSEG